MVLDRACRAPGGYRRFVHERRRPDFFEDHLVETPDDKALVHHKAEFCREIEESKGLGVGTCGGLHGGRKTPMRGK